MALYCYHIAPIDFWNGALTKEEMLRAITAHGLGEGEDNGAWLDGFEGLAQEAFREILWEGDIREGPYWFALPGANFEMLIGYTLKQSNNGSTFVACPVPLPHLDEHAFRKSVVRLPR